MKLHIPQKTCQFKMLNTNINTEINQVPSKRQIWELLWLHVQCFIKSKHPFFEGFIPSILFKVIATNKNVLHYLND